ncbi:MAG: hypothetical protein ACRDFZ_04335 [Candidatus Limnocylindria bacterium]
MSATKRPSTSSLRRFVSSRPYVPVAELRRRFGLDEPDDMVQISRNGSSAFIGVPAREAAKLEELWIRDELGVELSVDVRAPVVVGVFPMRVARYMIEHGSTNGHAATGPGPNGADPAPATGELTDDQPV